MIRVKNQRVITKLSKRSLKANRVRNCIAVCAIALTAMLFTALFTIAGTMVYSFQQETFRQVGGDAHGTFKYLTKEQKETLEKDPLIQKSGARRMLGTGSGEAFRKTHAELSYMDPVCVEAYFCTPTHGKTPGEGVKEIACDTKFLECLGIQQEIGSEVTVTYMVDAGNQQNAGTLPEKTDTFTLCGWWEFDPAGQTSMAILSESYVEAVQAEYGIAQSWDLNVYLESSMRIGEDLVQILQNNGYQTEDRNAEHYIAIGVNWAYMGAQASAHADPQMIVMVLGMSLLILLTGYLIIYNIFLISVSGDIRFYGLLKTIGTTGRQIRRMIRRQALLLSVLGIPAGLFAGWLSGWEVASLIMATMSAKKAYHITEPWFFLAAGIFTVATVLLSCAKPGRIAAKVSPVEAVRYTDTAQMKKKRKKGKSGAKPFRMAWSNLARSRRKTILVVISMMLAVVLLQMTYVVTNGFDMDKYLQHFVVSDFILGNADYFNRSRNGFGVQPTVPKEDIRAVSDGGDLTAGGCIYGHTGNILQFVSEDDYRRQYEGLGVTIGQEELEAMLASEERDSNGRVPIAAKLYGMEDYPLSQLQVLDGDLTDLRSPDKNAIAAVYLGDDYDQPMEDTNRAKVGDEITLRYVYKWKYIDEKTGETIPEDQVDTYAENITAKADTYQDVTYQVVACVMIKSGMSYRYYGDQEFVLNADVFQRDSRTCDVMTYLFDTTKESNERMQQYLEHYTKEVNPDLDFESKQSYVSQFESFRNVYMLTGSALSLVVGLIGILNYLNAVLTSIHARRREFAMLQSVGMTGRQLKSMLIYEGLLYGALAVIAAFVLGIVLGPFEEQVFGSVAWFFTYQYSPVPVFAVIPAFGLFGVALPLACYRNVEKRTVVERLRESE